MMVVDRTTVARNLAPLEKRGLVEIKPGSDKRAKLINTTEQGKETLSNALPVWKETQERIKAHYAHAQLAWFTFIGGKSYQTFLKQRMFLTIYGVISKKGYKIFDYNKNITTVKSGITAAMKGMPKAAFDSAPHLLLS